MSLVKTLQINKNLSNNLAIIYSFIEFYFRDIMLLNSIFYSNYSYLVAYLVFVQLTNSLSLQIGHLPPPPPPLPPPIN